MKASMSAAGAWRHCVLGTARSPAFGHVLGCALSLALVACGGGGGGSAASGSSGTTAGTGATVPPSEQPYQLSFSPGTLEGSMALGQSRKFQLTAALDRALPSSIAAMNILLVDPIGAIDGSVVNLTLLDRTHVGVELAAGRSLPPGDYTGSFQVRLCLDNLTQCSQQLPGSPFALPYHLTIRPAIQFTQPALAFETVAGDPSPLPVPVLQDNASPLVATSLSDDQDRFTVEAAPLPPHDGGVQTYRNLLVRVRKDLAPGHYTGTLSLKLCKDADCTQRLPGQAPTIPYTLDVRAIGGASPLQPLAGVPEWSQLQGSGAHTGHVPVRLDPSRFAVRWAWHPFAGLPAERLDGVITTPGRLLTIAARAGEAPSVIALDEADGRVKWQQVPQAGADAQVARLAASGDKVATLTAPDFLRRRPRLQVLSAASGQLLAARDGSEIGAPSVSYGLTVNGSQAFALSTDSPQTVLALDLTSASLQWTLPAQRRERAVGLPAVAGSLLAHVPGAGIELVDTTQGKPLGALSAPDFFRYEATSGWTGMNAPAMLSDGTLLYVNGGASNGNRPKGASNRLELYDLTNRQLRWSVEGDFAQAPAINKGLVYLVNGQQLEARKLSDGTLLWAWLPAENPVGVTSSAFDPAGNVVVFENLLFVSTYKQVVALDLATHKPTWQLAKPGALTVSPRGLLLTTSRSGGITAIQLQ